MTERQIENRVKKLKELEAQQKELEAQAEAIRAEIKADMESKGTDEIHTKSFIIRFKDILSSRFDSKAFKAAMPELYNQYCKPATSRRFTVA